jgi:hypothetical protein
MQKIEEMNEKLRATFEEKLKELETKIDLPGKTENPTSVSPEQAAEALKVIVSEFNEKLSTWYKDTGCVINFGWSYNPQKFLEILGIDYIVYRKEPPSEKTLKQALAQQPTS